MVNFWLLVNRVIEKADIIVEVLDARLWQETRNSELEEKVAAAGKKIVFVINKSDLVPFEYAERIKSALSPHCVFVSARLHHGTNLLRSKLLSMSGTEDQIVVGVVGYPNVGKSSIVNMLRGKGSAKVSPVSGQTRQLQKIKISRRLYMIDTPGVIPFDQHDPMQLILSASETKHIEDADVAAMRILELFKDEPERIEQKYGVIYKSDYEQLLEDIAKSRNKVKRGGVPDTDIMARLIIQDWQTGKLKLV